MHSLTDWVALIAAVGVAALLAFQVLLAAGFPLGAAAFGGANVVLPQKLRAASAASAVIFLAAFYFVLARGGLFGAVSRNTAVHIGIWVFATIFGLSAMANVASASRWERFLMAPTALLLCGCCVVLALSS
jgi:hypothetical protein